MSTEAVCVIIVGAGGIGSALFQDMVRFLPHTIDIHIMDGDAVEGKNLQRQHFSQQDKGRNKAEALQEKATAAIGLDRIYAHPYYLTESKQLHKIVSFYERVILIGAVDNHPARRVMERHVQEADRATYYVDCANSEHSGEVVAVCKHNVIVEARTSLVIDGAFRSEHDPSVLTDNEGDPTKASCHQQLDTGSIQTLYTNRKAAIIALEMVASCLVGEPQVGIVYFKRILIERMKAATSAA